MKSRSRRAVIFALALSFAAVLRADDLDTLLSRPPSASLTADDASRRIEMMRALAASHPDRADEIEAYLIPFVRATQPPPPAPTPTPVPPVAKAKPMLLIRQPDGTMAIMRATSYRKQGEVVIITSANGSRAVLQALTVVGELPWFSDQELASGAVDLKIVVDRYEAFAKAMPGLRPVLGVETARLRKLRQAREADASAKQSAAQSRFAAATDTVYRPGAGYTTAALARLLLAAEKARNEMPGFAAKIDGWAAPFREHFAKLLAGQSFRNGAWVSNAEMTREAHEKRQAAFLDGLDYQLGTEPFPARAVRRLVRIPLAGAVLALAAGAGLAIFARRRKFLRVAGVILLTVTPLVTAAGFFLATRDPGLLPATIPMADEQPLVRILAQAAGLDDGNAAARKISEGTLNSFLARHVRLVAGAEEPVNARQSLIVRLLPGRLAVFEMIRSMGLSWIVRIDVECRPADARPTLALIGAKIGALDCPAAFASELWKNLEPQFAAILSASRLDGRFAIQNPGDGIVELKPLAKAAPAAR